MIKTACAVLIRSEKPGSDVAGEWAAALAAAYLVFKDKGGKCTLQRQHALY